MPTGRRFAGRPTNQSSPSVFQNTPNVKSNDSSSTVIRHVMFPSLSGSSPLITSILHCALFLLSVMVQYLNLYKTVWWIPESPFQYAVNFRAIDYRVFAHIILMGLTPSLYRIILSLSSGPLATYPVLRFVSGVPLFSAWFFLAVYTGMGMETVGYSLFYRVYLYALLLYLAMLSSPCFTLIPYYTVNINYKPPYHKYLFFGEDERPVLGFLFYNVDRMAQLCFRMSFTHPKRSRKSSTPTMNFYHGAFTKVKQLAAKVFWVCADWPGMTPTSTLFPVRYITVSNAPVGNINASFINCSHHYGVEPNSKAAVLLRHQCLNLSAEQIREEVLLFRRDFNPDGLIYEASWCIQHGLVTWLSTFLLFWYYHLPADYLDMLHRSALHLGCWTSENPRAVTAQSTTWSPTQVYASGVVVKHVRGQFQSVEVSNAAEPGNVQHIRFHFWFHSPLRIPSLLMYISLAIPLGQLISLRWVSEWYKLIGMVAMGVFGLYNHYVHIRTYALLRCVYSNEEQHATPVS
ncbi:unnamed protein product [Echinostoma caproni]|uniref:Transmembrane protein n=1 Tax=Echinostoma caproni TaxID=27848 RepID=A0A183AL06_9TREM|nr:unnamed protein product [Echinostoma caproni]